LRTPLLEWLAATGPALWRGASYIPHRLPGRVMAAAGNQRGRAVAAAPEAPLVTVSTEKALERADMLRSVMLDGLRATRA
ncbi:MAG: hypothetical protein ACRDOD_20255, partial [Streptosporangiaceae bacterium]